MSHPPPMLCLFKRLVRTSLARLIHQSCSRDSCHHRNSFDFCLDRENLSEDALKSLNIASATHELEKVHHDLTACRKEMTGNKEGRYPLWDGT